MTYLVQLVIILTLTKIGAHLSNTFNFPSVIGELLVGILAGPAVLHLLTPTTFIHYFAEIGVIVLMFIAGLEGDFGMLMRYWKPALTVATLGVIFPTLSALLLCAVGFGFSWTTSLFIGLILSATSVSITVQVLKEMDRMNTPAGAIILGAAVADDIMCVILLGLCVAFFGTGNTASQPFLLTLLPKILFFVLMVVLAKWVVPKFLDVFCRLTASENETTAAMILCFGFAAIAVACGMSDVLGAYIAGLAISETPHKAALALKVEPIGYAIFIPVFFVSIGLNISFVGMGKDLFFIGLLILIAILGKQFGGALGARLFGLSHSESHIVGAGMISRGEMALVVSNVALGAHLIDQNHYTAMIVVTVVTTLIAPVILKALIQHQTAAQRSTQINEVK
ncbi:cation:proton antiporter [Loigolactobacillus bifermentans]|uniref:Na(+) H(+) antiporter n=1 Tax=Loigolactobacillus bifermentans DSM 20003 TaxID=1423726 RepID=A0A0R1H0C7_9LACO|nr:cation:proton antiporter [Loigolactobacillus bifermentans]KRK40075.1 Na(+) H(+) antiporter [Loigolactobacillus bifermentans DSM 20003]QGG61618.1 sodium:proton antiporter [Loigolactobacillus bifermentans]